MDQRGLRVREQVGLTAAATRRVAQDDVLSLAEVADLKDLELAGAHGRRLDQARGSGGGRVLTLLVAHLDLV